MIHTHPDIGIFLSGIDVRTFGLLRSQTSDGRIVAVVVDPLRKEHGVFNSERAARGKDATKANGKVRLSEDLVARYHKFLDRMRFFQQKFGKKALPFIMPGILSSERVKMGDVDDIAEARNETLDNLYITADKQQQKNIQIDQQIKILSNDLTKNTFSVRKNSETLEHQRKYNQSKYDENTEYINRLVTRIERLEKQTMANTKSINAIKKHSTKNMMK